MLWRALTQHGRLWLVTVGLPPADPTNGVEAWLAREAFKTDDRWLDDARLALFVTASRLEPLDVRARLGDDVRLLGARLSSDTVHPGGTIAAELTWVADSTPGELRGFVQLIAVRWQPRCAAGWHPWGRVRAIDRLDPRRAGGRSPRPCAARRYGSPVTTR